MTINSEDNNVTENQSVLNNITNIISEISSSIAGFASLPSLLDQVARTTVEIINAEVCSIFLEDKQNSPGYLTMLASAGYASKLVGKAKYEIGEGFTGGVAQSDRVLNITNIKELEELTFKGKQIWKGKHDNVQWHSNEHKFRNLIAISLKLGDRVLGVIKAENKIQKYGNGFTKNDEFYLSIISNFISVAIENLRLREENERQLMAISAKAAHRIGNQTADYDGILMDLQEQIESQGIDKERLYAIRKRLQTTTKNIKKVTKELSSFGKPLQIKRELEDIHKVIKDEAWLSRPPQNIKIRIDISDEIPLTLIDKDLFADAIRELILNAKKAIKRDYVADGIIVISTKLITKKSSRYPDDICIEIEDNGPGFPEGLMIIKPFQTTDLDGTGLGLYTVKEIIEAHGGTITICKSEYGGAKISLTLPVVES